MTIRRKFSWLLVGLLTLVFALSAYTSIHQTSTLLSSGMAVAKRSLETAAEGEAESIFTSLEIGTRGSLERGEMEPFAKLLTDLGRVRRVEEIGLADPRGRIKFANRPEAVSGHLRPVDLAATIAAQGQVHTVRQERSLLLLRPHRFEAACLRCHGGARNGDVAGVLYLRYSLASLRTEQHKLATLLSTMEQRGLLISFAIGAGMLLITFVLVNLIFGSLVSRPLGRLGATIQAVDQGRLDVQVGARGSDEIANVSHALDRMTGRLGEVVTDIEHSSSALSTASGSIARSVTSANGSAERQVTSVRTASAAVEDIVSSVDRVGRRVNALNDATAESSASVSELGASIGEVAETAETLAQNAEEISTSVEEINASIAAGAQTALQLKASATSSAASVTQMTTSVQDVERHAQEMATIAGKVATDAQVGHQAVEATIRGIAEIRAAFDLTFAVIQELSEKMKSIGAILSVIDEVTGQTNLLALNAAIIAAQAGEHGKGFSVVADEIRDLADRTGSSTRDIAQVIAGLRQETARAVEALKDVDRSIHDGRALSLQAGVALSEIVAGVAGASAGLTKIVQATVEQAAGIEVIRSTVTTVSESLSTSTQTAQEQNRAVTLIARAVGRSRELADQVRRATREQSTASRTIARSVSAVNDLAREIREALGDQQRQCDHIVVAVQDIRATTDANLATTHQLTRVVTDVSGEVEGLRAGVDTLRRPEAS